MSALSALADVDWNVVAAAVATFVVTATATWAGLKKGTKKVSKGEGELTSIVGGSIMDNLSMQMLSQALHDNTVIQQSIHQDLTRLADCLVEIKARLK